MYTLLISLLLILSILIIFDINGLYYIKRSLKNGRSITENESVYRLDSKIELQKYVFVGTIAIASFFGYTKYSELIVKAELLQENFGELTSKYNELILKHNDLSFKYSILDNNYEISVENSNNFEKEISKYNMEFQTINYKLTDATRQIPENNIKAIAKLLAQTYLVNLLDHGPTADAVPYSNEYIERESVKIYHLLVAAGFSSIEAKEYFNEITKNTRIENKIKISN